MKSSVVVKACGQELWDQQESFVYDKWRSARHISAQAEELGT